MFKLPAGNPPFCHLAPIAMLGFGLSACDVAFTPSAEVLTDASYGKRLFAQNCAACHGRDATGGGAASLGLGVVPPDLTQLTKKNGGTYPRNRIMSVIDGYSEEGHAENPMPTFGDGDLGVAVQVEADGISTPIPADLLALANYLESIQS